jgi:DNA replication protein DnaC
LTTKTEQVPKEYRCNICKDEEVVLIIERDGNGKKISETARDCDCKKVRRIDKLMKSSKITEEFQGKTFKKFDLKGRPDIVRKAREAAFNYTMKFEDIRNKRENSICLLGRPGCGKTHLLMAVSNNLISKGIGVVYFPWVEGFNEIKDDFDMLDERIKRLQMAEVLYIDDMFKGRKVPTEFQVEQLFAIINYRYLEKKPVLISSERSIMQICEIDEGIGSRIVEMSDDYRVVMTGGIELNYRLKSIS